MRTKFLHVVIENGEKYGIKNRTYTWSAWNKEGVKQIYIGATNFAEGLVNGFLDKISFTHPAVKQIDGYWWKHGEMIIKVINGKGKIVKKPEDI